MRRSTTAALVVSLSIVLLPLISGAQGVPSTEICNGKDDNGNGVVDDGVNCDHYLSYLLDKSIQPISVVLRDQFINQTDFTLVLIERLLNPVRKLHAGIAFNPRRPDLHYLAYRVQTAAQFAPRTVLIDNQFEKRQIVVTKPRYLLTPTGKRKIGIPFDKLPTNAAQKVIAALVPPVPQNANHYLCWDIEPYDIAKGVFVRDQFQNRQFEVIRARYLCNPTVKTHDGKVYDIVDEKNHVVCYEVIPHNTVNRNVLTHDQFGVKALKAVRTEELCLPTVKTLLPTECIPQNETCNGIDDDCDGIVDDVPGIGTACTGGGTNTTGVCTAQFACTGSPGPGPNGLTCSQVIGPTSETCNGVDDDCDGSTDEGLVCQ